MLGDIVIPRYRGGSIIFRDSGIALVVSICRDYPLPGRTLIDVFIPSVGLCDRFLAFDDEQLERLCSVEACETYR